MRPMSNAFFEWKEQWGNVGVTSAEMPSFYHFSDILYAKSYLLFINSSNCSSFFILNSVSMVAPLPMPIATINFFKIH